MTDPADPADPAGPTDVTGTPEAPALPRLSRRPGRRTSYALVVGSAAVLALAGAGLPLAFSRSGSPAGISAGAASSPGATAPATGGTGDAGAPTAGAPGAAEETGPAAAAIPAGPPAPGSTAAAAPGAVPDPGLPGATAGVPGAPLTAGSRTAGPAASAGPGRSAAPGRPGATATATSRAPGTRAGTGAPGTARPTGAGAAPAAGTAQRTASDTGITADTVTLGALLTDFGTANQAGASATGYSPEQQQEYFDAYAADVNAHGGIGGRTLKMAYRTSDITSGDSQKAACDSITDTDKSFAVTNVLGIYGPPILCLTQTHQVPYVANDGAVLDYYDKSGGRLFTLQPSTRRTQANAVFEDVAAGEFRAGDKVGVLREDGYLTADELAVEDYIRGFGITVTDGVMSSSNVQDAPGQAAVAAQRFCSAGVTKVFLAVNALYAQEFIASLPPGCAPAYYSSDFDYQMDGNTFVSGMPAAYFTHAVGVSSSRVGDPALGPSERSCLAAYNSYETAHGQPAVAPGAREALQAVAACGLVRTFVAGLERAGTNPTRASFVTALTGIGSFDDPGYDGAEFHPGKTDAPDSVRVVRADQACKCWQTTGDGSFHPAHFR